MYTDSVSGKTVKPHRNKKNKYSYVKILSSLSYIIAVCCALYFIALAVDARAFPRPEFDYIWIAGSALFFVTGRFWSKRWRLYRHDVFVPAAGAPRFFLMLFAGMLTAAAALCAYELPLILKAPEPPPDDIAVSYMIILGGGTLPDGTVGKSAAARIRTAAAYLHRHPGTTAVVTEGQGPFAPEPGAYGMKRYLESRGIFGDRIICETQARNTEQNFIYSAAAIAQAQGITEKEAMQQPLIVVTSRSHVQRSLHLARRLGYKQLYAIAAPVPLLYVPSVYLREVCSLAKMQVLELIDRYMQKS